MEEQAEWKECKRGGRGCFEFPPQLRRDAVLQLLQRLQHPPLSILGGA